MWGSAGADPQIPGVANAPATGGPDGSFEVPRNRCKLEAVRASKAQGRTREVVISVMWGGNWDGWGGGLFMVLTMLIVWGGLVWLVVYAIRASSRSDGRSTDGRSGDRSAIQILEERFARGEIDRNEFEERRRVLRSEAA